MSDLELIFRTQHESFARSGAPDLEERLDALALLRAGVVAEADALADAVQADFGRRARTETRIAEILTVTNELTHIRRHLRFWMKPRRVPVDWTFWPARAWIRYEPLGVVGVIGAWNYPIVLSLSPLANALSAGNRVMLKLPERTPAANTVLESLLNRLFPKTHVAVVTGGVSVGEAFARLPFDHLLFTGSTEVGRQVLTNASAHLTPVTLELGGKSPAIVDRGFPLRVAAGRIAAGKFLNAGQTCIAPDYVLLPQTSAEAFERYLKAAFARLYPGGLDSPDYTWIIDPDHWARLGRLLEDAAKRGGRLVPLVTGERERPAIGRAFPPTLVYNCHSDMAILREEIFGPILPIVTYEALGEAVAHIRAGPAPLALYYFGGDRKRLEEVLRMTCSGGVVVNDTLLHFVQNGLPFGGVGESGMGQYHGLHGFLTFSKARGVFQQGRWSGFTLLYPPYGERARRLLDFLIKRR
ncbi:MAG: coniferyl aldehyde dehydrogenase [Gammaproteobacteria bacterium]